MYNKVILIGTIDSHLKNEETKDGNHYTIFFLKTKEKYFDNTGQQKYREQLHNVIMWNNLSDLARQKLKKDMNVTIEGKLITTTWIDKNGETRIKSDIQAKMFKMN